MFLGYEVNLLVFYYDLNKFNILKIDIKIIYNA